MKGAFKFGSIKGIGIYIHWTFSLLIIYIIFNNYMEGQNTKQIIWSLIFVLSIFITVFLHELGHALAARRYQIKTKDITILPIGGLARLDRIPEKPMEELIVAIAGPAVNIALALITGMLITFPKMQDLTVHLNDGVGKSNFFLNFFIVNIWLAVFNLIPAFPMDGGRVLRALLAMKLNRRIATNIAARIGQILAIGFIFLGFFSNPFLVFVGLFIFLGAQAEASHTKVQSLLAGHTIREVMIKDFKTIDHGETVKIAVQLLLNGQQKNFLITEDDKPVGTLSRDEIIKALYENGENTIIKHVMNKNLIALDTNAILANTYQLMQIHNLQLLPVFENNKLVGALDLENILEFIMVNDVRHKK